MEGKSEVSAIKKVLSALFYGITSILIMIVNKNVLTNYGFPSAQFLAFGQMMASVIVLYIARALKIVSFPSLDFSIPKRIFPLPLLYFGNIVCGLGGTKQLSFPMFTVLRRFTILLTLILEFFVLSKVPSRSITLAVLTMVLGAIVAASDDLAFDMIGYVLIFSNDIFTATNGVFLKKQLNAKDLGTHGIIFYSSLFMFIPSLVFCYLTGDLKRTIEFDGWNDSLFLFDFFLSCIMGFILTWSVTLCTACNSALTTTVVGTMKNVVITYYGMIWQESYVYSFINAIGINISIVGGIIYSYITFIYKQRNVESSRVAESKV